MTEQDSKLVRDIAETFGGFLNDQELTVETAMTICITLLHQVIVSTSKEWGSPKDLAKLIYTYCDDYHCEESTNES